MGHCPMSLEGKRVLITGASSGIGQRTAIEASRLGAKLILVARDEKRLVETLSQLECDGHAHYSFDLSNLDEIPQFISRIVEEQGRLSGIFHAAGADSMMPVKLMKQKSIENAFRSSCFSFLMLAKSIDNKKVREEAFSFVVMSSVASISGSKALSIYSSCKAAVNGAVRSLAVELAEKNIRVNAIASGIVTTQLTKKRFEKLSEDETEMINLQHPLGIGDTKDVAYAAIFLLSDASKWITGTTMVVDGGFSISK